MLRDEMDDSRYWLGIEAAQPGTRFDTVGEAAGDEVERRLRIEARKQDLPQEDTLLERVSVWSRLLQRLRLSRG